MSDPKDDSEGEGANRRRHPRTPLSILVQFRFHSFEDFLAEYAVNISPGGMFIRTEQPRELGTLIFLQFQLEDGSKLIEGLGRVCWVTHPGNPDKVPGMGVEFVNFDEASTALIEDICARKQAGARPKN